MKTIKEAAVKANNKEQQESVIIIEEITLDEMEELAQVIMGGRRC